MLFLENLTNPNIFLISAEIELVSGRRQMKDTNMDTATELNI